MADNREVLAWVKELGQQAFAEARTGNAVMLNRLGVNSSLKLFLDNVIGTGNVVAESFPAFYPAQWQEITRLYEEYKRDEKVAESVDKVAAIEVKLDTLAEQFKQFLESQKQPAEPAKKPAKKAKADETESEANESAESEA